jgi:hypothetical protein
MTGMGALPSGLVFLQTLSVLIGAGFAAFALVLWAMESGQEGNRRRILADGWRVLSVTPWPTIPRRANGWLVNRLQNLIRFGFEDADKGIAFGIMVFFLLFIVLPGLALLNMLFGGSSFLVKYYLLLFAIFAFLNFAGEIKWMKTFNTLTSAFLGISLFIVIPVYVLRVLTEMSINNVFSHAVLKSPLVAVFWYLSAYGIGMAFDTFARHAGINIRTWPVARFVHGFLAAVPFAFILTFLALLAGHLAVFDQNPARTWTLVLVSTGVTAFSFTAILSLMKMGGGRKAGVLSMTWALGFGLISSTVLSLAVAYGVHFYAKGALTWSGAVNVLVGLSTDGDQILLGPDFWIMHLPFLPWFAFLGAIAAGLLGKGIAYGFDLISLNVLHDVVRARPFYASAMLTASFAGIFWSISFLII